MIVHRFDKQYAIASSIPGLSVVIAGKFAIIGNIDLFLIGTGVMVVMVLLEVLVKSCQLGGNYSKGCEP